MHMAFPIEEKLVIAIASSAVLTLDAARDAFREKGLAAYRQYQREHQQDIMERGPAFTFVRRLLNFNKLFPEIQPVEVVLLSHNDADTGRSQRSAQSIPEKTGKSCGGTRDV